MRAAPSGGTHAERPWPSGPQPVARARRSGPASEAAPGPIGRARHSRTRGGSPRGCEMSPYPTDHAGLEILSFDRCLELLATVPIGRVSFLADGEIVVLPVNYLMDGTDPVFRTARGS